MMIMDSSSSKPPMPATAVTDMTAVAVWMTVSTGTVLVLQTAAPILCSLQPGGPRTLLLPQPKHTYTYMHCATC
jgi:hypothetical protein